MSDVMAEFETDLGAATVCEFTGGCFNPGQVRLTTPCACRTWVLCGSHTHARIVASTGVSCDRCGQAWPHCGLVVLGSVTS